MRTLLAILIITLAPLPRAQPSPSPESHPVEVFAKGVRNRTLHHPVWRDGTLTGTDADERPVKIPLHAVRVLRFPVAGETLLAQKDRQVLEIRDPVRFKLAELPDGLQYRFTIPMETGLYFTPLVGPSGGARRNTFRFWIGEKRLHAQGRGVGRTEMNAMESWNRDLPRGTDACIHLELYLDRKGETAHLRINHQHIKSWKIPTSYESKVEGDTWAVFRSGIDPQHIEDFSVHTWSSRRYPDPEERPGPDRDAVWLQNGDLLSGTVTGLEDGKLHITLDSDTGISLPTERIREIRLSPRTKPIK